MMIKKKLDEDGDDEDDDKRVSFSFLCSILRGTLICMLTLMQKERKNDEEEITQLFLFCVLYLFDYM